MGISQRGRGRWLYHRPASIGLKAHASRVRKSDIWQAPRVGWGDRMGLRVELQRQHDARIQKLHMEGPLGLHELFPAKTPHKLYKLLLLIGIDITLEQVASLLHLQM